MHPTVCCDRKVWWACAQALAAPSEIFVNKAAAMCRPAMEKGRKLAAGSYCLALANTHSQRWTTWSPHGLLAQPPKERTYICQALMATAYSNIQDNLMLANDTGLCWLPLLVHEKCCGLRRAWVDLDKNKKAVFHLSFQPET